MFFSPPHQRHALSRQRVSIAVMQSVMRRSAECYQVPRLVCVFGIFVHGIDVVDDLRRHALAVTLRELAYIAVAPHNRTGQVLPFV